MMTTSSHPKLTSTYSEKTRTLWITTLILLIVSVAILIHVDDLSMWYDELFSIFHSSGTAEQILRDRDVNWPPFYYLSLNIWIHTVGAHDIGLRLLSGFAGILATACVYQISRYLHSPQAGWLAAISFGTSGYIVYYAVEIRAYAFSLLFGVLLAWIHLAWVKQPNWRRTIIYYLITTLWLYTHFSSGIIIALSGFHLTLRAPHRIWRWLVIMTAAGLTFIPLLPQFALGFTLQSAARQPAMATVDLNEAITVMYRAYSNYKDAILAIILTGAVVGLAKQIHRFTIHQRADLVWIAAWGPGLMIVAYITPLRNLLFSSRYLLITAPAIFILIGLGLANLSRFSQIAAALLILILAVPWRPFEFRVHYTDSPPVRDMVRALAEMDKPGDMLVVDPDCKCGPDDMAWQYYQSIYYPDGRIPIAADGSEASGSVWYLVRQGSENRAVQASVEDSRIKTNRFWGPWYFIATYYEKPPLTPGYPIGDDGLHFRGVRIEPDSGLYRPGDTIHVQTWWSTTAPLSEDYSFGLYLVRYNRPKLIAENNAPPTGELMPIAQTAFWEPGEVYRDDRTIQIPWGTDGGYYSLWFAVYRWYDNSRLAPAPEAQQQELCLVLDTFEIVSWGLYNH